MRKVILGKTNIQVSYVGMGVMPIGPNQLHLPLKEGVAVVRYALDRGITFLDTAQYYSTYPYIREALKGSHYEPVISSKSLTFEYGNMLEAIEEARQSMDRDIIDIFLMHEVRSGHFKQRRGAWEALNEAKEKGLVKAIGVSTHNIDVVQEMVGVKECDVVFPLINYAGLGIRNGSRSGRPAEMIEAINKCHETGKGIYAMKIFGGGNLTTDYQKALNYIASKDCIDSIMIGFGNIKDIDDIFKYMEGKMPKDYNPDVSGKKIVIEESNCEGCGTCLKVCQSQAIFYNERGLAQIDNSKCLTCGYCAPACPCRAIIYY